MPHAHDWHEVTKCPRQDSNLRSRLRRAVLYPLSYGGAHAPRTVTATRKANTDQPVLLTTARRPRTRLDALRTPGRRYFGP